MKDKEKIALFIDADNAPASKINFLLSELNKLGVVNIRRAYGNWKRPQLKPWEDCLFEHAIQPIQQFDLIKGKNATDIAMVVDVMDALYTQDIDIVCIMSSDSDFTPLALRLSAAGKIVIGAGCALTAKSFVSCCSAFFYVDSKPHCNQTSSGDNVVASASKEIVKTQLANSKTVGKKMLSILIKSVGDLANGEWADMSELGTQVRKYKPNFSAKNYNSKSLSKLLTKTGHFEFSSPKKNFVRVIQKP